MAGERQLRCPECDAACCRQDLWQTFYSAGEEEGFLETAMEGMKQRVATGHLTSIGESTTQLKAMCFRQDSGTLPLREPLQAVLAQLEELRRVNRELRMQALQFGWEWDDASRSLVSAATAEAP